MACRSLLACLGNFSLLHRKCMSSRRPCRHWSTLCLPPPHTILRSGQLRHPPTAMSVKGSFGALPGKAWSVWSAEWSATRSVRTSSALTVCRVSTWLGWARVRQSLPYPVWFPRSSLELLLVFKPCYFSPPTTYTKECMLPTQPVTQWVMPPRGVELGTYGLLRVSTWKAESLASSRKLSCDFQSVFSLSSHNSPIW